MAAEGPADQSATFEGIDILKHYGLALDQQKNAGSFGAIYEVNEIKTVRGPYVKPYHRPSDLLAKMTYLPHATKTLDRNLGLSLTLVRKYILTEMMTSYTYLRDTACPQILPILDLGIYVAKGRDGRRAVYAVYILEKKGALPAADFPPMYRQPPLDLLQLSMSSGKWLGSERPAGSGQGPLAQKLAPSRALLEAAHAARRFAPNKQFDSKLGWRLTRVGLDKLVVDLGKALASLEGASTAVLHRDLKTGNIVVDQNPPIDSTTFLMKELVDEHTHYVVIDHSLGKVVFYTATQTAQPEQTYRIGAMATAAPEVIWKSLGEKRYGTEVDIYSVSITVLQGVLGAGSVYASVDSGYHDDQETLHEAVELGYFGAYDPKVCVSDKGEMEWLLPFLARCDKFWRNAELLQEAGTAAQAQPADVAEPPPAGVAADVPPADVAAEAEAQPGVAEAPPAGVVAEAQPAAVATQEQRDEAVAESLQLAHDLFYLDHREHDWLVKDFGRSGSMLHQETDLAALKQLLAARVGQAEAERLVSALPISYQLGERGEGKEGRACQRPRNVDELFRHPLAMAAVLRTYNFGPQEELSMGPVLRRKRIWRDELDAFRSTFCTEPVEVPLPGGGSQMVDPQRVVLQRSTQMLRALQVMLQGEAADEYRQTVISKYQLAQALVQEALRKVPAAGQQVEAAPEGAEAAIFAGKTYVERRNIKFLLGAFDKFTQVAESVEALVGQQDAASSALLQSYTSYRQALHSMLQGSAALVEHWGRLLVQDTEARAAELEQMAAPLLDGQPDAHVTAGQVLAAEEAIHRLQHNVTQSRERFNEFWAMLDNIRGVALTLTSTHEKQQELAQRVQAEQPPPPPLQQEAVAEVQRSQVQLQEPQKLADAARQEAQKRVQQQQEAEGAAAGTMEEQDKKGVKRQHT